MLGSCRNRELYEILVSLECHHLQDSSCIRHEGKCEKLMRDLLGAHSLSRWDGAYAGKRT